MQRMEVYRFIGQLHVPVVIPVIIVLAPVMHAQEVHHTQMTVSFMMLLVMEHQRRHFQQLIESSMMKYKNKKQYVGRSFFHEGKDRNSGCKKPLFLMAAGSKR